VFHWLEIKKRPIIIAHRGASTLAPENTLEAFSLAIESHADAIELDVQLCKDNHVVVIHDFTLQRTTSGTGNVQQQTLKELKQLSAGEWFDDKFRAEKIPTLQDVLKLVNGRIGINIELKHKGGVQDGQILVEEVVKLIEEIKAEQYCLLSSFHHQLVRYAFKLNRKIARGFLFHSIPLLKGSIIPHSKEDLPHFIFCNKYFASKRRISQLHQQEFFVGVYTVNKKHHLQKALRYGTDCIFTDNPDAIQSLLQNEQENTAFG
jgi:glycerophosphoryl diester phosphodiesterase